MRVLIAVTHLLGAGHLTRAAALARAFAAAGHETVLVSGGRLAPLVRLDSVRLVQLPPLRIQGFDFARLIGPDGETAGSQVFADRKALLLDTLSTLRPDAVLTELFPFGRRGLADEFMALVQAARNQPGRPLILASVRDILVPPDRRSKVDEAHARVAALYDAVLVHGDPALAPLDASWPVDPGLAGMLRYTGYVDEGGAVQAPDRREGVLVAAGSSAAGLDLFRAAIAAARLRPDLGWRILVGHFVPDAELARLSQGLPPDTVMRARPDYRALMAGAAVSVSQCGYNTAVDLMVTGTPAVLVPFEAGRETEQRLRAERLAAMGLARIVPENALSPETLLAAVLSALRSPQPNPGGPALDGSTRTVAIVQALRNQRHRARGREADRLRRALDRAAEAGRSVHLWWRDDDAVAATPALDRLLALAAGRPILIAAIPARTEASLNRRLAQSEGVTLAVHGLAHENHAPPGQKSAEFGPHRPLTDLCRDALDAHRLARERLPEDLLLPVFVPPWNRIAPDLAAELPRLGYGGLSAAGGAFVPGLARADAALDVIDWRGTRSLRDPETILAAIAAHAEEGLAGRLGLLTHHLAHDEAVWDFIADLLPLLDHPAVRWHDPRDLFGSMMDSGMPPPISLSAERPRAG
ncbi:glycosyltransferase [Methylobacterium persicinum]|uniref:Glycosyltransferase n=1 Tax=Methylobacterium persicinum TaxID=374426 RepID=A0ABU0HIQ6_9HYPH|nr:glycosyltransferase [Methylobacterium persicinum]MDQ0442208.1 putative glycosyltransferase [Methylobacterium persicinum]GJE40318.1 UDP-N-acetylglucosamine--N-acetylmuramyl-(pentapeptide) pyrophosphoryl-undecaprenol N-acetylglucosamine transferase [Methylobacterium persicinum]